MDKVSQKSTANLVLTFLIVLNCIAFLNKNIFDIYVNLAYYGNLLALVLIILIKNKINRNEIKGYFFLVIFFTYGLFTLLITKGGFGSILTIAYSFLLIFAFRNYQLDNKKLKILLIIFISINIYWFFNSKGYYIKAVYNKEKYINSNTIGMLLMYTAIYIKIILGKLKIKFYKFIYLLIYLLSIIAIINCESRGSLLTLLLFIFMDSILPKFFWRSRRWTIMIIIIVIVVGTVFPYLYTEMYAKGIEYKLPFTSKSLYTGREIIWLNYFNLMGNGVINWLFGLGSNAKLWSGESLNLHNNYLAVITNFGVIGYFLYYLFLIKQISMIYKKKKMSKYQISSIIVCLSILINGFIEVSTIWHMMFFFNFLFIGLASSDDQVVIAKKNISCKINNLARGKTEMVDFLIMYEVKQRELESIILVGNELKKRGFSVEYLSFFQIDDKHLINKHFNNVKVVLTPSLYHNEELMNIIYHVTGKVKRIVNLQWEQVGTVQAEQNNKSYMFPKEQAKNAVHICWGKKPANNLVNSGVSPENAIITGPLHMDLLRPKFIKYFFSKHTLLEKYKLDPHNHTILFISSFVYSNLTERQVVEAAKAWGMDWVMNQRKLATNSFDDLMVWFEELLRTNKNINFIYRPHPAENGNNKLVEMQRKFKNFRVISEHSVKQWILTCDTILTWISTSIAEAYFAGKACTILRPIKIPLEQEMTVLVNSDVVDSIEKFLSISNIDGVNSVNKKTIESYYDVDENQPSFIRLCDKLEEVLNNEKFNFLWDEKLVKNYEKARTKNALLGILKRCYTGALRVGLWLQKKTQISFGQRINQRITNYEKLKIKVVNNIASNEEIEQLSKKIQEIAMEG